MVECVVSNDEAPGSKPGFSIFCITMHNVPQPISQKDAPWRDRTADLEIMRLTRYQLRQRGHVVDVVVCRYVCKMICNQFLKAQKSPPRGIEPRASA